MYVEGTHFFDYDFGAGMYEWFEKVSIGQTVSFKMNYLIT
jgi:hypothetical protein